MATLLPLKDLNPLGLTATTASTPVKITHNYTDLGATVGNGVSVHALFIRALPGNTGNVYILKNPSNPQSSPGAADKTNYLNVVDVLQPGEFWSSVYNGINEIVPDQFYIDVDTNADGVISVVQVS